MNQKKALTYKELTKIKENALEKLKEQVIQQIEEITVCHKTCIMAIVGEQELTKEIVSTHINEFVALICSDINIELPSCSETGSQEISQIVEHLDCPKRFRCFCENRNIDIVEHIIRALLV